MGQHITTRTVQQKNRAKLTAVRKWSLSIHRVVPPMDTASQASSEGQFRIATQTTFNGLHDKRLHQTKTRLVPIVAGLDGSVIVKELCSTGAKDMLAAIRSDAHGEHVLCFDQLVEHALQLNFEKASQASMRADAADQGIHDGMRLLVKRLMDQPELLSILLILPDGKPGPGSQQH